MEDDIIIFSKGRRPQIFSNGRLPQLFVNESQPKYSELRMTSGSLE